MPGSKTPDSPENRKPDAERQRTFRYFFYAVLALLLSQLLRIFSPFLTALAWSVTLTLIFYPLHERVARKVKQRHTAALISTAAVMLVVITPALILVWFLFRESADLYPTAKNWVETLRTTGLPEPESMLPQSLSAFWHKVETLFAGFNIDLQGIFLRNLSQLGETFGELGGRIAKNVLLLIVNLLVLMLSLFFFFQDGAAVLQWGLELVPMERSHKEHLALRLLRDRCF